LPEPDRASLQERPCLARLEVVIEVFKIHFSHKMDEFYAVAVIGGPCRGILGEPLPRHHLEAVCRPVGSRRLHRRTVFARVGSPKHSFRRAQHRQRAVELAYRVPWKFTGVMKELARTVVSRPSPRRDPWRPASAPHMRAATADRLSGAICGRYRHCPQPTGHLRVAPRMSRRHG
jgi:hypothetical protein